MTKSAALVFAAALSALAAPLSADPLEEAKAAYLEAWQAAPLTLRRAVFAESPAVGYGMYDERASNVFARGEPLLIYIQPEGYGWLEGPDGNTLGFTIDLRIGTQDGVAMLEQDDFMALETSSLEKPTDFFGNLTITLTGFPKGAFLLTLIINDIASDKTTSVELPFEVQ